MPAKKKSSGRRYSKGASKTVASAVRRKKSGTLKSGKGGKGGKVKSRKQAIAIGLSEARKKGQKSASYWQLSNLKRRKNADPFRSIPKMQQRITRTSRRSGKGSQLQWGGIAERWGRQRSERCRPA